MAERKRLTKQEMKTERLYAKLGRLTLIGKVMDV